MMNDVMISQQSSIIEYPIIIIIIIIDAIISNETCAVETIGPRTSMSMACYNTQKW